jgi:hypothetical protein
MSKSDPNNPIKRAFATSEYQPEFIQELIKCKRDPIYFIEKYVKVQHPTRGEMPFILYDYQKRIIDAIHNNKDTVVLASRQLGKCVVGSTQVTVAEMPTGWKLKLFNLFFREQDILDNKIDSPLFDFLISKRTVSIDELNFKFESVDIPDTSGKQKFIGRAFKSLYVQTPTGFAPLKSALKTIEYDVWALELQSGQLLECADQHLVIDSTGQERQVKSLTPKDHVKTKDGQSKVVRIGRTKRQVSMYDLELDDKDHVYFTNGILSHNTTVVAAYILWFSCFQENKLCVIASKAMSHATEIMSRVKFAYESLPHWLKPGCKYYSRTSIEFDNGSKIKSEATSEKTGRGGSPSLLFIDELAFINKRIQEEMWASISPSLSTGGKFVVTSTPNGDNELYAQIWRGANAGTMSFVPVKALWYEHPERGEEYYKEMLGKLGPVQVRQELDCCSGSTLVNTSIGLISMEDLYANLSEGKDQVRDIND